MNLEPGAEARSARLESPDIKGLEQTATAPMLDEAQRAAARGLVSPEAPGAAAGGPAQAAAREAVAGGPAPHEALGAMAGGSVLDEAQRSLLRAVLNRIIPAGNDLPGAGDLEVGVSMERTLAESTRLRRLVLDGLTEIAVTAQRQTGSEFSRLDTASQTAVLQTVEQRWPDFFMALVEHTYRGYYTLAAVQVAVGFEPRPPQPLGHQLPPFDPAVLEVQRQRAPFWRRTS